MRTSGWVVGLAYAAACSRAPEPARQAREPIAALERGWGHLVTVANVPTRSQQGNGDRVGFFDDGAGTVWGLPLAVGPNDTAAGELQPREGPLWGCAPAALRRAPVTDSLPARLGAVIGAMNAPTGYRGGTGRLEVVLRDSEGVLHWARVKSDTLPGAPICGIPVPYRDPLRYYRLIRGAPPQSRR